MLADADLRTDLPYLQDTKWTYGPPIFPSAPTQWIDEKPVVPVEQSLKLKVASYNARSLKQLGAISVLRQQCRTQGIHIIGLQETRVADTTTFDTDYVRYIGNAVQGQGGVELWVSVVLPTTQFGAEQDCFQPADATVLHAESELLLVALHIGGLPLLCVVAHAPHKGHTKDIIHKWWDRLRAIIRSHKGNRKLMIYIDANASVNQHEPHTGDYDPQELDTSGADMLKVMQEHDLFAPSTCHGLHQGDSATWHSAKTTSAGHRNDYILLDLSLRASCLESKVNYKLDAGNLSKQNCEMGQRQDKTSRGRDLEGFLC